VRYSLGAGRHHEDRPVLESNVARCAAKSSLFSVIVRDTGAG
jgi:hypothetical protein